MKYMFSKQKMNFSKNDEKSKIISVKSGQKVQISLPKLCNYDDEDEEEDVPKPTLRNLKADEKPITEKPRSGLLGILPAPKSSQNPFLKKANTSVNSAPVLEEKPTSSFLLPRHIMSKVPIKIADQDTEYPLKKSRPPIAPVPDEDPEPFAKDNRESGNEDDDDEQDDKSNEETEKLEANVTTASSINQQIIDKETMLRLCGSNGKKRKMEDIKFTEVSASQIVGDNKSELLKQVTDEYRPPTNKEYFTTSSRRTHHVTYLAKVAVERDQELRATWASNKFNRKMAREKYGF